MIEQSNTLHVLRWLYKSNISQFAGWLNKEIHYKFLDDWTKVTSNYVIWHCWMSTPTSFHIIPAYRKHPRRDYTYNTVHTVYTAITPSILSILHIQQLHLQYSPYCIYSNYTYNTVHTACTAITRTIQSVLYIQPLHLQINYILYMQPLHPQ